MKNIKKIHRFILSRFLYIQQIRIKTGHGQRLYSSQKSVLYTDNTYDVASLNFGSITLGLNSLKTRLRVSKITPFRLFYLKKNVKCLGRGIPLPTPHEVRCASHIILDPPFSKPWIRPCTGSKRVSYLSNSR